MRLPGLAVMASCILIIGIAPSAARAQTQYQYGDNEAQLGASLAAVGDLNGDGFPDFVAGAYAGRSGPGAGRVFVYFGGAHQTLAPGLVLGAGIPVVGFGVSVAGGQDMNGDGYPDLIVGASGDQLTNGSTGAAYVFFGGPAMHTVPDLVLPSPAGAVSFGYRVSFMGDHNGDGYADLAVGAPAWNNDPQAAHVFVYDGGATPATIPAQVLDAPGTLGTFGTSLAYAGDVNGDGYGDFLAGEFSPDMDPPGPSTGSVYLYFGGVSPRTIPDLTFTGAAGEMFGCSMVGAIDLNRDGFDDIVIASPRNNPPGVTSAGMIQVFYGGPAIDTRADVTRFGRDYARELGISMASGDINGDGIPDLACGSTGPTGGVAVYFGGAPLHASPDRWIPSSLSGSGTNIGYSVAVPGDRDGDGLAELVAGAPHYDTGFPMIWQGALQFESGLQVVAVPDLPRSFTFLAPAPNPARDVVSLSLTLDHADRLSVEAYDVSGRIVARPIENEMLGPGPVSRAWSLGELPAGIYWVRARFANRNVVQRVVHLQGP